MISDNLRGISDAIDALTENGHLPMPGTVIISESQATIMPEFYDAPISVLLSWSEHLDGTATFVASLLEPPDNSGGNIATVITAHGLLNGVRTVITAHTMRPFPPLIDAVRASAVALRAPDPWTTPIPVTWLQVLELSLSEKNDILPKAKDHT